jgi:hypothetical protein
MNNGIRFTDEFERDAVTQVGDRSIDTAVMQLECSARRSASNSTAVIHPAG